MKRVWPCFVCGDPVLDLVGQDVILDTFYLRPQPSPADAEVLQAKAYGDAHLRCFVGSRWAPFWVERIGENMEHVRGLPVVSGSPELVLLRHEVLSTRRTIAIRRDGWYGFLDDDDVRAGRPIPGGALLPVSHDFNLDLTEHRRLWEEATTSLTTRGSYPLMSLVEGLGLRRRLWSDTALEDGRLEPAPAEPEDGDDELWVEARAVYARFVPDDVLEPVLALLPDARLDGDPAPSWPGSSDGGGMALYTVLVKVEEDERAVRYRFGPDEDRMGLVELDKLGGLVHELEPVPGVSTQTDLSNARKHLLRLLARGNGFPVVTAYEA